MPALLALPGIGAYTARAVAAFAYRQRQPVVDTNVRRVVARVVGGEPDGGASTTPGDLAAVERLLPDPPETAARLSVAIMDLGAVVCVARAPPLRRVPAGRALRLAGFRAPVARRTQPVPAGVRRRRPPGARADHGGAAGRGVPVDRCQLDDVWHDPAQRKRALESLVEDGLSVRLTGGRYTLPGMPYDGAGRGEEPRAARL